MEIRAPPRSESVTWDKESQLSILLPRKFALIGLCEACGEA